MGAEVERGGGKVATRKFRQTNTPAKPKSAAAPPLRRGGSAGGRSGRTGPRPGTGTGERRAPALPAKVSEPGGCGADPFPYLFIYLFSRPPSPLLRSALVSTPFSGPHSCALTRRLSPPPPGRAGRGEGASGGSGPEGRRRGMPRGRAVLWVSCAKCSAGVRAGGGGRCGRSDRFGLLLMRREGSQNQ